ncbi:MAG: glycosyl transferase family 1 [Elusimicrobia bacterium]|nr:glycosyl transferase family 1 [Elusimicrobiota bacterium]
MKKVLFMPAGFSLAHVGRLVTLAQALPCHSYEVTFACDPHYHRFIPDQFRRRLATSLRPDEFRRRLEKGQPLIDQSLLRTQVEEDIILMRSIRPDLVVGDFRPSLGISAPLENALCMNVINALWSPWSKEPFQLPLLVDIPPIKWLGARAGRKLMETVLPLALAFHCRPFNRVRRDYGLKTLPNNLRDIYSAGDFIAYADLPLLAPTPGAPAHHQHIGPVLWEPDIPLPDWWEEIPADKPLVYVSVGSTGRTDFLPKICAALTSLGVVAAVSTAGRTSVSPIPGKIYVADYLPGLPLSQRASLVVNNGGSGGVYQALTAGVPVLGIAANMDQCMVMNPVVRHGAGKLVMAEEAGTYDWRRTMTVMLNSSTMKTSAQSLSRHIAAQSAPDTFRNWVNQILGVPTPRLRRIETNLVGREVELLVNELA